MTPSDIEVLLHYNTIGTPHPRIHAPAVRQGIEWFVRMDVLAPTVDEGAYELTPRGKALLSLLCNTLMPTPAWLDAAGNIITK
jgi:hypothetical protein